MAMVKTLPLFTSTTPRSSGLDVDGAWEQKKRLAEMLMQGDNAPVYSAGQGLTRVAKSLMGGWMAREAEQDRDRQESASLAAMREAITGTTGLPDAPSPFPSSSTETSDPSPASFDGSGGSGRSGGGSRAAAANERARRAHARLVEKGYSEAAAAGIVANAMKESSMNTGAVGDNGTAFGLFQHRGPRFENLKKFAASQGKDWRDFDTNLDFADHEMRNNLDPGAGTAFKKLQTAKTAEEAADIFMNYFERPSPAAAAKSGPERRAFAASLVKQGVSPAQATAIASAAPAVSPEGPQEAYAGDRRGNPTIYPDDAEPPMALPPPDLSAVRARMARGQALMRTRGTFDIGMKMYQQAEAEGQALLRDYEKQKFELLRDERKERSATRREIDRYERERGDKRTTLGPGQRLLDADGNIVAEGPPKDEEYTLSPGAARYKGGQKIAEQPAREQQGTTISYDEQGRPVVSIGGTGGGKRTELQAKYGQFYIRGTAANKLLDTVDAELTNAGEAYVKDYGPRPLSDFYNSQKFKSAKNAADNFLITIIRPDTGAAVTDNEMELYGGIFLPRPGDGPEIIAQKRMARQTALEALQQGMAPEQILQLVKPEAFDGKSIKPNADAINRQKFPKAPDIGTIMDGHRYKGGDPAVESNWEKLK